MATFSHEAIFEAACQAGEIPGAVLAAADASGKFNYLKAFGKTAHGEPFALDSVMWMASCTKLMTAVSALQQVERGNIKLDDDISKILPELLKLKVLKDIDGDGKPVYEENKRTFTLRILLTHTSGLTIPLFNPTLQKWWNINGPPTTDPKTVVEEFSLPLVFEPGTSWMYGTSYDWAGKLVERLSGLTLEEYMKANIWGPLGMQNMSFTPDLNPELKARKVGMTVRAEGGKLAPTKEGYLFLTGDRDDNYGGAGSWGAAESYVKLLQSLCANDGKVLGKETVEEMFRPQLDPEIRKDFNAIIQTDDMSRRVYGNSFDMSHQVMDHGLGGEISTRDEPGRRKAGTMSWGGLPNLIWWVDRKAGLCGTLFTNLIPVGDAKVVELQKAFETSVYEQYEEFKKQ